ncbi:hypothetical protein K438DRAFT_2032380 [Mycena galopus ATCC 62051]|nr:hypothetical protein K438DRAFT_2032380 [Mycena galopus ATCC 62051]
MARNPARPDLPPMCLSAGIRSEECYVSTGTHSVPPPPQQYEDAPVPDFEPVLDLTPTDHVSPLAEDSADLPAYAITVPCDEEGVKLRQMVTHMDELKAEESVFLKILLSLHYHPQLLSPCECGRDSHFRTVACNDCLQAKLLCSQCWVNEHRTMPMHWGLVWNTKDRFFEKRDFCQVRKAVIALGHYGLRCPQADAGRSFSFVESNGIHSTAISFCWCKTVDGARSEPEFQQLLCTGIFPGSVKEPKTGYTLGLLEYYRQQLNQGKGSAYHFIHVLKQMADPFFEDAVPAFDFTVGDAGWELQDESIYKSDDGSDMALTDGRMYFPKQTEFEEIAKLHVVNQEDTEVPCKAHIGSVRHQGLPKYGNTTVSSVIACACDHTVVGSFVDMLKGEAFALGTYTQRQHFGHYNSPPHNPVSRTPMAQSYDGYCSFVVNMVKRAHEMFPEQEWLHELLVQMEGQIPADHINRHGPGCQAVWQAVYFNCRAHFHGETAEMLWAFLNPLGSSTRQMTGGARHDTINFVMDAWNVLKVLRQARLLADE